jgi:hypothetical protein
MKITGIIIRCNGRKEEFTKERKGREREKKMGKGKEGRKMCEQN